MLITSKDVKMQVSSHLRKVKWTDAPLPVSHNILGPCLPGGRLDAAADQVGNKTPHAMRFRDRNASNFKNQINSSVIKKNSESLRGQIE